METDKKVQAVRSKDNQKENLINTNIIAHAGGFDFMRSDWEKSGISTAVINDYINNGYIKVDTDGYYIYYPDLYKNCRTDYYNKRLRFPTKDCKYIKPKSYDSRAFKPLHLNPQCLINPKEYLIITEGEKKAIKAVQEGFNCIALSGVWAWKKTPDKTLDKGANKKDEVIIYSDEDFLDTDIIPDIANANFNGKEIYLCYDNDMWQKEQVKNALYLFSAYLISEKKAIVKIIELPKMEEK